MKSKICYLFSILFLTITSLKAQENFDEKIKEVENGLLPMTIIEGEPAYNILERMQYYNVPGISVTVIENFEPIWTKHYGVMDSDINNPVNDETLFNVGSLSKGLAALTVLTLVRDGKIDLDLDVNQQLISWKVPENEFTAVTKPTPRMLMNHTGGAMHLFATIYLRDNFPTITQTLNGEPPAKERPTIIDRIPGTEFLYSNPGFAILQQLVIDASGKPFYQAAKENIFDVIGMNQSTFEQPIPIELEKFACAGHMSNGKPFNDKRYFISNTAAGGLWTTTDDYAKFITEIQKSFHNKSNKIIPQDLTEEMISPQISDQYGLGVFMRNMENEKYFGHMGDNAGFFAGYLAHSTDGYGVVVFTNSQNGAQIIREINKAVAKVYKWKGFLTDPIVTVDVEESVKNKIAGRYKAGSDEIITVENKNGDLFFSLINNEKLFHTGENKFVIKSRLGYITFLPDENGNFISAKYHIADELGRFMSEEKTCSKVGDEYKVPSELLNEGQIEKAMDAYRGLFSENKNDPYLSENRFNALGYQYIGNELYEKAIAIFRLNVEFYPQSSNCYDSLGEAYMKSGNKELAIKSYNKVLELDPNNQNAKNMLEKLSN